MRDRQQDDNIVKRVLEAAANGDLKTLQEANLKQNTGTTFEDRLGATPIHFAARSVGSVEVLSYLVERCGLDARKKSRIGATAAHDAAATGNLNALVWLLKNSECDTSDVDFTGATCVHLAARYGHSHVLKWLVNDAGCLVRETTHNGALPLHFAAARGDMQSVRFLVDRAPG